MLSHAKSGDDGPASAAADARIAALEAAVAARDRFIATIGHEMRNPIVPILLSVERLRALSAGRDLDRIRLSIEMLDMATGAFMRRANQLLDISRFSGDHFTLVRRPVDFSALLAETAARHTDIARRAGCTLHQHIAPGLHGLGDLAALEQLIDNLLSNAFKYGAGRPVTLGLSAEGDQLRLEVRDQGIGIAAAAQSRIFGLFERAAGEDAAGGFGVGLWIAAKLVAAMHGTIRVESTQGQGAVFLVTLPLAAAPAEAAEKDPP